MIMSNILRKIDNEDHTYVRFVLSGGAGWIDKIIPTGEPEEGRRIAEDYAAKHLGGRVLRVRVYPHSYPFVARILALEGHIIV